VGRHTQAILLGYELGTGKPVEIPVRHLCVTGQTQESGKTTTLEALISRSGKRAIAFITKRGERSFENSGRGIPPYFQERADWEFIESVLEAIMRQKMKFERAWIVRACKAARCLADVRLNLTEMMSRAKRSMDADIYMLLGEYLDKVLPLIARLPKSSSIELQTGLNVMDLRSYPEELQMLVISSAMRWIHDRESDVITILPEAWKFAPQGRNTPVKLEVRKIAREGAGLQNYIWTDSIPGYESILTRINGQVRSESFSSLYTLPGKIGRGPDGEEVIEFAETVEVPTQTNGGMRWRRVKGILRHPWRGTLLSINTVAGVVDVSPNHPVLRKAQRCYRYEEAGKLRPGHTLSSRGFYEDKDGRELAGQHQLFVGPLELAWFYGIFAAEGWVSGDSVCVANSNSRILQRAAEALRDIFHLSPCTNSARLRVGSVEVRSPLLADHMRKIAYVAGGDYSSRTKKVPDIVMNACRRVQSIWLEGYFAGDGTHRRGRVDGFGSVSRPLATGVLFLSRKNGTVSIRSDKPDFVQVAFSQELRNARSLIKKIHPKEYEGYLYDLVNVESADHSYYAGVGNIRISNSQDIAGVEKEILRAASVWLLGVQREANEIERALSSIPKGIKRPKEGDIPTLKLGQFFACWGEQVKKVYVRPAWMIESEAVQIATGKLGVDEIPHPESKSEGVNMDYKLAYEEGQREIESLRRRIEQLESAIKEGKPGHTIVNRDTPQAAMPHPVHDPGSEVAMALQVNKPVIDVTVRKYVIEADDSTLRGRLAVLISQGFFDSGQTGNSAFNELQRRGAGSAKPNVYRELDKLAQLGFVTKEPNGGYLSVPGMKVNVKEVKTVA